MIAFSRGEVVKHMLFYAELHVLLTGLQCHLSTWSLGCVQSKATAVKALLSLNFKAIWGLFPGRLNDHVLIILVNGQGSARHRELNEEDKEQHYHVEEQEDLVMSDCTDQSNDRDHQKKNATSSDSSHNWQGGYYA